MTLSLLLIACTNFWSGTGHYNHFVASTEFCNISYSRQVSSPIIADPGNPYVTTFQCLIFFQFTSRIFYGLQLTLSYFTSTTSNKDEKEEQLFLLYNTEMSTSSVVAVKQRPLFTRRNKAPREKVGTNWFYTTNSHNSNVYSIELNWIALQHMLEQSFSEN